MGIERLIEWQHKLEMKKKYFTQRKGWARRLVERLGLTKPGDRASEVFGERQYEVEIGPRGGINIHGVLPWQGLDGWRWFEKSSTQRKRG